jgi:hypothetical protein
MLRAEVKSLSMAVALVRVDCEIRKAKSKCHTTSLDGSDQFKSMLSEHVSNLRNL